LQGDNGTIDSTASLTQNDERPAKKPRIGTDMQPAERLRLPSVNVDVSATATAGENTPFVVDLTTPNDSDPRSPLVDGRLSLSNDSPVCLSKCQELCLTEDNCTSCKPRQLCSESCTVSPPASPELQGEIVDCTGTCNLHQQSVNGVHDISLLRTQYQSATMAGCRDRVTDELANDCCDDLVVEGNGFPSMEPTVAGRVVNGGSIVQDCSL